MMDTKVKSVCLLCLKRFEGGEKTSLNKNAQEAEPTENDTTLPYQHNKNMSILETCLVLGLGRLPGDNSGGVDDENRGHQQQQSDLYSRFLLLTGRYLKVTASESLLLLEKQRKRTTGKNVEAFCEQCQILVGKICDLYAELQVVKMKLLGRVEELENVTRQSVKSISLKLARVLIKAVVEQLNINSIRRLELFRKSIALNCHRKIKQSSPQVLVPRGLFPEQWVFTYSATKLLLMRLILVFALAAPPTKQEEEEKPVKTEKSSSRKHDDAMKRINNKDDIATCTDKGNIKRQRKVVKSILKKDETLAESRNETTENYSDIDDDEDSRSDLETGGCDDNNDSDWSVGAAPSPAASSESEDEPIHSSASKVVDPKFYHVPRSLQNCRPQRLAVGLVKVICEEDDNDNGSSDNLDYQKIIEYQLKHCPTIDPDDPFLQCKLCNESYPCRDKIRLHLRRVHKIDKVFHCNICALQFRTTFEVRFHKQRVHPEHVKKLTCPKCPGRTFFSARNLSGHLSVAHNSYLEHVCSICGYKAKSSTSLMLHAGKFHGKRHRRRKSEIAIAEKEGKGKMQKKNVKWKTDKYANVPCEVCQKTCESGPSLRKHLNLEHEHGLEEDQNAACSLCFMKFSQKQTLELHVAISHSRRYKFVCDAESCNEYFFFQEELNRHLEKEHLLASEDCSVNSGTGDGISITEPQANGQVTKVISIFYCQICNCGFVNADALELHQISHTKCDDNKLYCCPNCDEKVLWLPKLVEHFNVAHGKLLKIYKCLECPAKYPVMVSLRSHTVNHHKESRTYNKTRKQTNGNESVGSRRKYTTDFNQRCPHCPQRKFRNAAGLASHLSVHHHMCTICHYQAKCRKDLNLHKADNHKEVEKQKEKAEEKLSYNIFVKNVKVLPKSVEERIKARDNLNVDMYTSVPCQVCQIICGSGPTLRKHLNAEHEKIPEEEKPIPCTICCMRFAHEQTHELHFIVAHLRMYKFVCDVECCDAHFVNRQDLNAHLESVHLQNPEESEAKDKVKSISYCKTCNWGFTNPYVLELHELRHSIGYNDPCPVCKKKKDGKQSVVDHYNVVHGKKLKLYKCLECPAKAYQESVMHYHVKRHNKTRKNSTDLQETNEKTLINLQLEKEDAGFVCRDCGEVYPDISKFRFHKLKHYPTAGYLACVEEGCERAYSSSHVFRKHRILEHNTDHYICPEKGCGKALSSYWTYWHHKREHDPSKYEEAKQYIPCKEKGCERIFHSRSNMRAHWARIHKREERVKNYLCSVCGQSFFEDNSRKAHERDMHGPPRFQCDICQKKFKKKQHWQNHRRRHDPEDATVINCVCAECGKAYKTERGLELHVASTHTPNEQKRFACPECPYRTHRAMLLRMHLKGCLRNKGIPYDEKKWGKLPAAVTKNAGPPRKPGRKPGWNKRKREESSEEEEMEEKSTTEEEDSDNNDEEKVEEKVEVDAPVESEGARDSLKIVRKNSLRSSFNQTEQQLASHQVSPRSQPFGSTNETGSHHDWENAHSTAIANSLVIKL